MTLRVNLKLDTGDLLLLGLIVLAVLLLFGARGSGQWTDPSIVSYVFSGAFSGGPAVTSIGGSSSPTFSGGGGGGGGRGGTHV